MTGPIWALSLKISSDPTFGLIFANLNLDDSFPEYALYIEFLENWNTLPEVGV